MSNKIRGNTVGTTQRGIKDKLDRIKLDGLGNGADPEWQSAAYDNIGTHTGVYVEHFGSDLEWRPMLRRANNASLSGNSEVQVENFESNIKCSRIPITNSDGRLEIVAPDQSIAIVYGDDGVPSATSTNNQNCAIPLHYADKRYTKLRESDATYEVAYTRQSGGTETTKILSAGIVTGKNSIPIRDKTSQNFHVGSVTKNNHPINTNYLADNLKLSVDADHNLELAYTAPEKVEGSKTVSLGKVALGDATQPLIAKQVLRWNQDSDCFGPGFIDVWASVSDFNRTPILKEACFLTLYNDSDGLISFAYAIVEEIDGSSVGLETMYGKTVTKTEYATTADSAATADHATTADSATTATNADHATTADSATSATKDNLGNTIAETYATIDDLTGGMLEVAYSLYAFEANRATTADSAATATNADHATTADSATSATKDNLGNTIAETYAKLSNLTDGSITVKKANTATDINCGDAITSGDATSSNGYKARISLRPHTLYMIGCNGSYEAEFLFWSGGHHYTTPVSRFVPNATLDPDYANVCWDLIFTNLFRDGEDKTWYEYDIVMRVGGDNTAPSATPWNKEMYYSAYPLVRDRTSPYI